MLNKTIIIFDLWQTLADSPIKPSNLFDELFSDAKKISKELFLETLFSSDLYKKDINLEQGLEAFLTDLKINNEEKLKKIILLWEEMAQKSFLIEGAEKLLLDLKNKGYKICLLTNIDKYGYENFPYKSFLKLFDYQFLSYKNNLIKPDIECWKIISKHYETDYKDMVMIGDSFKNDISPSKNIGVETITIDITRDEEIYNEIYSKFINN
jgi:HAD superfamily hydrolase (TIGR01549 family)